MEKDEIKKLINQELGKKLQELGISEIVVADELPKDEGETQWICAEPVGKVRDFVVYCIRTVHKTVKAVAVPLTYLSVLTFVGNLLVPDSVPTAKELALVINAAIAGEDAPEFEPTDTPLENPSLIASHREEFIEDLWDTLKPEHVILTSARRVGKASILNHLHEASSDTV